MWYHICSENQLGYSFLIVVHSNFLYLSGINLFAKKSVSHTAFSGHKMLSLYNMYMLYSSNFSVLDYVGFIKRVMKQLQHPRYNQIKRTDVDLRQLNENEAQAAIPGRL